MTTTAMAPGIATAVEVLPEDVLDVRLVQPFVESDSDGLYCTQCTRRIADLTGLKLQRTVDLLKKYWPGTTNIPVIYLDSIVEPTARPARGKGKKGGKRK